MNHRFMRLIGGAFCTVMFAGMLSQQQGTRGPAPGITINEDDQTTTLACTGSAVTVSGDDNNITLKGDCSSLTVSGDDNNINAASVGDVRISGDDNKIAVETVARISVSGDDNKVEWKKGVGDRRPEISNSGDDNDIKQD